jgi:hypothetical protein
MRIRRKVKRTRRDSAIAEERRIAIETAKIRRGARLDFTEKKLNSRNGDTGKTRTIVKCNNCGRKGVLSKALFPSLLVIHRGTLKQGRFSMSDYCVNGGGSI